MTVAAIVLALVATSCALIARYNDEGRDVASSVLVEYQLSGGVAGMNQHLVVFNDGRAVLSSPTTESPEHFRLNAGELRRLKGALARTDWPQETGRPDAQGADTFVVSIEHDGRRVVFVEPDVPPSVRSTSAALKHIVLEHQAG
jgi:hypothetical protein